MSTASSPSGALTKFNQQATASTTSLSSSVASSTLTTATGTVMNDSPFILQQSLPFGRPNLLTSGMPNIPSIGMPNIPSDHFGMTNIPLTDMPNMSGSLASASAHHNLAGPSFSLLYQPTSSTQQWPTYQMPSQPL